MAPGSLLNTRSGQWELEAILTGALSSRPLHPNQSVQWDHQVSHTKKAADSQSEWDHRYSARAWLAYVPGRVRSSQELGSSSSSSST